MNDSVSTRGPSARRAWLQLGGATALLMLWSMLSQLFPWGVPTVAQYSAVHGTPYVFISPGLVTEAAGTFTTNRFDDTFAGTIATLATDRSFTWLVSVPRTAYQPARYFAGELLTQLFVALGLMLMYRVTRPASRGRYLQLVAAAALLAGTAIYGSQVNWWGMPPGFAAGMVGNLLGGWLLASWWIGGRGAPAALAS
jgi:hypothetical protein